MKHIIFILLLVLSMGQTLRRNYGADLPPGTVLTFAGSACPYGFLKADGAQISRTGYPLLFAAISTNHGAGNGVSTFHLPDYRGRFLRTVDESANLDPDKLTRVAMNAGGAVGNAVGSVQSDELESHFHAINAGQEVGTSSPNQNIDNAAPRWRTGNTAATGGTETRPVNAYVLRCIKY